MIYFLDANACLGYINGTCAGTIERLDQAQVRNLRVPAIVAAKLLYGAKKSNRHEQNLKIVRNFLSVCEVVPFDGIAADCYARISHELDLTKQAVSVSTLIIASIVIINSGVLVSDNPEFSKISGLLLEDWS